MRTTEQYRVLELEVPAGVSAEIRQEGLCETIRSFRAGSRHLIRFMPMQPGRLDVKVENGSEEAFEVTPAGENNHGPVRTDGMRFVYADGTPYLPFGTTCYAWTHQPEAVRKATLETLGKMPFNKVRMCLFPKHMIYSENEPERFPFERREDGTWDTEKPDEAFWEDFEQQILALDRLGIEADLILFHPYDRWGFADMPQEDSLRYLDYAVRRLGANKNIWWSLANEYDLLLKKTEVDWEAYAARLLMDDGKHHLRSIHNCCAVYPKKDWMTHVSVQTGTPRKALALRAQYALPVIVDEFGYEGNIEFNWGNLTGREFVHRAWTCVCSGAWPTHGETLLNAEEHLWWAKGGTLLGETPSRIRFLKELMASLPGTAEPLIQPLAFDVNGGSLSGEENPFLRAMMHFGETERIQYMLEITPTAVRGEGWLLYYLGRGQSRRTLVQLPEEGTWRAEVIDTWNMERKKTETGLHGNVRIELGGSEGMALLLMKEEAQ